VPVRARRSSALQEAVALRNRAALELLYGLGLRVSEACEVRVLDLDLPARVALVRRAKRGKPARLPLPEPVVTRLQAYLAHGRQPLLRNRDLTEGRLLANERGRPLTRGHLERLLARTAARAGLAAEGVHPHMLRRSVASHMVRRGASLPAVRHFLGHRLLETTQRYVAVDLTDLRAAVDTLEAVSAAASSRPAAGSNQPQRRSNAECPTFGVG
jgi:site-specific recombinase XerD